MDEVAFEKRTTKKVQLPNVYKQNCGAIKE